MTENQTQSLQQHDTTPSCKRCANRQNYDGVNRCSRYHDSLCDRVYDFCKGKFFLDIHDGVSLYAMRSWLNRLTSEEMDNPLVFEYQNNILVPMLVFKSYNYDDGERWVFYSKSKTELVEDK